MNSKILIVASTYYKQVTDNLVKGSTKYLEENNFEYEVIFAPGCFEIPFLINKNINDYQGFISLGCIIRGETYHFELISNECSRKIIDISINHNKPIGFGILTKTARRQTTRTKAARAKQLERQKNMPFGMLSPILFLFLCLSFIGAHT